MSPWQFNIRHIRAFTKTYELGSLIAASRTVHMSQPAMTQAISKLEAQLNVALFHRQSSGMQPSEGAALLYPRFKAFLEFIRSSRVTHSQIRAFLALARTGSYIAAHEETGLARASLHRAVSDLEKTLKQKLVQRRGRGLELSDAGHAHARRYSLAEAEMRSALEEIEALKGAKSGRIAVGAMPLCRARVLPAAMVEFLNAFPNCDVYIAEGSYSELLEPLRNGDLDLLIGAMRDEALGLDLEQMALFEDVPVVIARNGHTLAENTAFSLQELRQYEWCIPPRGVPLRERWEDMFQQAGLSPPKVAVACGSVMTIRQILLQTDYLTVLSPDQVAVELEAKWLKIIGPAPQDLSRTIGVTHRTNWRPTSQQSAIINFLKNAV